MSIKLGELTVDISELTIVSASWNCSNYLESNWRTISQYPTEGLEWIVANNNPEDKLENISGIENFTIIEGVPQSEVKVPARNRAIHIGSWHHAAGLNKAIPHIKTRYVLFLDPDFFVAPPLKAIINYMDENDLAFFGSPYAIDKSTRPCPTFPCVYCMFVDTSMVDISKFDFSPQPSDLHKGDTGTKIYLDHVGYPHESVLQSVGDNNVRQRVSEKPDFHPYTEKTIQNVYGVRTPDRAKNNYFWGNSFFGTHVRMKMKERGKNQWSSKASSVRKDKTVLSGVESFINTVRQSPIKKEPIPLFKVFMAEKAADAVNAVLWSGNIAQGQVNKKFELTLKSHFGENGNVITVNSCTSAIHLALDLIKTKEKLDKKTKVVCSPLTCAAGIFPIISNGMSIQWCDISEKTLNIDLDALEKCLDQNTRIVSFVHWGGYPIDYKKLSSIKKRYAATYKQKLYIVEDCAHAWESKWQDELVVVFKQLNH